jgi:hypothetical protein
VGDHGAIADASDSLMKLLRDALTGLVASDHVTLASPADIELDTAPWLALFLYHVLPNPHLVNRGLERIDATTTRQAATAVDLYYLFVPYAQNREDEQKILGRTVQALAAIPVLHGSWLVGSLAGSKDQIRVTPHPLQLEEQLRLWNAFANQSYKLSATFLMTPVEIESSVAPIVSPTVVERRLEMEQA